MKARLSLILLLCLLLCLLGCQTAPPLARLPNGMLLGEVPGHPQRTNNYPTAAALSPDDRYAVFLNGGYGAYTSGQMQSLSVLDLKANQLSDFPDSRLGQNARQSYFLGLAFSPDGRHLYASMASLTDPLGKMKGSTGNGIAVYSFENGRVVPERFIPIPPRLKIPRGTFRRRAFRDVTYPAGLAIAPNGHLLVACNHSDEAVLLDAKNGELIHRFDLSVFKRIPGSLPYTSVTTSDGGLGFVSLWNASRVAELALVSGRVLRMIPLLNPSDPLAGGSHPTAMVLSPDESILYVALTDRDRIAAVDVKTGRLLTFLSTKLPGQKYGGSDPESLAISTDGKALFSANSISDSVAVFDLTKLAFGRILNAEGFIPTEWYPTVVAATSRDLLIATAKGRGTGPNTVVIDHEKDGRPDYPYTPAMTHGSLGRIAIAEVTRGLKDFTREVTAMNAQRGNSDSVQFVSGERKIRHVIYIIKENRTYDQLFGDIRAANGDPSLAMYGKEITPNQHRLALQFGVLDNFYDSGDISGEGHIWSNSATISDYVSKVWPVGYRGNEHTYDSEGMMMGGVSLSEGLPYAGEPTGGFLWQDFAKHGVSYRHYGEFIISRWCNAKAATQSPTAGTPFVQGLPCPRSVIEPGQPLPENIGEPHGSPNPFPWPIPILARDEASVPALRGHFDPRSADFKLSYPDQFRVDEFLNEFRSFVKSRKADHEDSMPQFIQLRLPDDHTAGGTFHMPTPSASVADNDLAVGRVVDAVSHSPYWDDTAILILEDDSQDGPDHVDSHRSIALLISKYAPLPRRAADGALKPYVEHRFYTTVNVVRTIEALLDVPPMNNNDSHAAVMTPVFSGPGTQPAFSADYRNRDNGLIYRMNTKKWAEGEKLDFSRADAADARILNRYLWHDRMGSLPMPEPQHHVFPADWVATNKLDDDD